MKDLVMRFAALINSSDIGFDGPTSADNISKGVLNAVYFWAGAIAVIIIVVAGFLYTTSNGNSQQISRAKNAILGACIGLVIVGLAFTITNIVLGGF